MNITFVKVLLVKNGQIGVHTIQTLIKTKYAQNNKQVQAIKVFPAITFWGNIYKNRHWLALVISH